MNTEIVLATNNKHKLHEMRMVLSPLGYTVYCPNDLNINIDIEENGSTYQENSLIKAKTIANLVPFPVIADDSGFEIISLNNFPGLNSSRFASKFSNYNEAGRELNKLVGANSREAQFRCVICYLKNSSSKPLYFEGLCKGELLKDPHGTNGFGYDPFFYSYEIKKNFGEISEEEKNRISHRSKALKKLITYLSIK